MEGKVFIAYKIMCHLIKKYMGTTSTKTSPKTFSFGMKNVRSDSAVLAIYL